MARQTGFQPAPITEVVGETIFDTPLVNVPSLDVIELLPERAQDRLRKLRLRSADLHKVLPGFDQTETLTLERIKVERQLRRLVSSPHDDGYNLPPTDPRVISAQRGLDKLSAELARLSALQQERTVVWRQASQVLDAVESWLKTGRPGNTQIEAAEVEIKLLKGEDVASALDRVRKRAVELKANLAQIAAAKLPSSHLKAEVRRQIEALAAKGAPTVAEDGTLQFPQRLARAQVHNVPKGPAATAYFELVDPTALAAFLMADVMCKRADALIDASADDKNALSPADRERRSAEAQAELIDIEMLEASLVFRAWSEGLQQIEHRVDAHPEAVLGIRLQTLPRAVPSSETSPQWVTIYAGL